MGHSRKELRAQMSGDLEPEFWKANWDTAFNTTGLSLEPPALEGPNSYVKVTALLYISGCVPSLNKCALYKL